MFTNDTLKGRTALITGGGTGIGLEIATSYAKLGASVMLVGRNEERVEAAAQAIMADGGTAAACRADVRNYDDVSAAVQATVERFGALDILVNNAAGNFVCPTAELSLEAGKRSSTSISTARFIAAMRPIPTSRCRRNLRSSASSRCWA